jgi:hypothetical protein
MFPGYAYFTELQPLVGAYIVAFRITLLGTDIRIAINTMHCIAIVGMILVIARDGLH